MVLVVGSLAAVDQLRTGHRRTADLRYRPARHLPVRAPQASSAGTNRAARLRAGVAQVTLTTDTPLFDIDPNEAAYWASVQRENEARWIAEQEDSIVGPLNGDGPGARHYDPLSSHVAADMADMSKPDVKAAVLELVRQYGALTGQELNELYKAKWEANGWPKASFESPRRRAGELQRAGRLRILNHDNWHDGRGEPAQYTLLGVRS